MSRFTDVVAEAAIIDPTPLPIVDWLRIGGAAPKVIDITYGGPQAPLPKADVVVISWTAAEWSAFDHVFLNSAGTRLPAARDWQSGWYFYSRNAPPVPVAPPLPAAPVPTAPGGAPGAASVDAVAAAAIAAPPPPPPFWGYYALVEIATATRGTLRVLLFKSNSHLAHAPGLSALAQMTGQIIDEVSPSYLYSIGTAGGARTGQRLGDVVVTDCAQIQLKDPINAAYFDWNGKIFTCASWYPPMTLMEQAQAQLFFPMSWVVSYPALQAIVARMHQQVPGSDAIGLDDLLNDDVDPVSLHRPRNYALKGTPLLTTDYYFIADVTSVAKYAFLEMDDAVLAKVAGERNVKFAFARNISDPVVPTAAADGTPLSDAVRSRWSGLIYETYGLYTSFNGAVATWATLAAL